MPVCSPIIYTQRCIENIKAIPDSKFLLHFHTGRKHPALSCPQCHSPPKNIFVFYSYPTLEFCRSIGKINEQYVRDKLCAAISIYRITAMQVVVAIEPAFFRSCKITGIKIKF